MNDNKEKVRRTVSVSQQLLSSIEYSESVLRNDLSTSRAANAYFDDLVKNLDDDSHGVSEYAVRASRYLTPHQQREVSFTGQDVAVKALWSKTRLAYDVDFDAWESIGEADPSSKIPREAMFRLPHPNPLLVFPEPILLESGPRHVQRVVGAYVSGCRPARGRTTSGVEKIDRAGMEEKLVLCSTHHPDAIGWTLTFAGMSEDRNGRPIMVDGVKDVVWTRSTLPLVEGSTLGSLAEKAVRRFNAYRDPVLSVGDHKIDVPILLARAVNMLIYLGAVNVDLEPIPWAVGSGRNARRSLVSENEPPEVFGVGYRVGAQLRAWKKAQRRNPAGAGTGGTVKPHFRRSHNHGFWRGRRDGERELVVKWLWPIPVNMGSGGATETTIIPIK